MRTLHRVPVSSIIQAAAAAEEEELYDELSEFPDDVLGLVVSFLPTKEAVATSILSTRWRYVWATSPAMNFDLADFPKDLRSRKLFFINFVEDALHHFNAEKLSKFRLRLGGYEGHPKPPYQDWIAFAVQHRAEEIDVCLPKGRDVKIPVCLFNCSWLKSLSLKMMNRSPGGGGSSLPSPARLRMLGKLHLSSVPLPCGDFLREIFTNCLKLEEVSLVECKIGGVVEIDSENLHKLTIRGCHWAHPVRVSVTAPGLRTFCYYGSAADEHKFERMDCLEEVELDLTSPSRLFIKEEQSQQCVLGLMEEVGNVHTLKLSSWSIENLCRVKDLQDRVHRNVRCLILRIMRKQRMICLAPLIASCSYLRELKIAVEPSENLGMANAGGEDGGGEGTVTGKTESKHLKSLELAMIDENKTAKELISYLLETAPLLERMRIIPSNDGLDLEEFKERISTIKTRWSSNVVVDYHNQTAKKRKQGE